MTVDRRKDGSWTKEGELMVKPTSHGVWDAADCALLLIDYQPHVMDVIFEQDRRVIELNVCTLSKVALAFKIPVVLSTVGVEMGANQPTIAALREALPGISDIDRPTMDAWEDSKFRAAVKATGRRRLVMAGIATSVCLAYPVIDALADGYEVTFVADAVGDSYKEQHDLAVLRLGLAGAVPNSTIGIMAEWFRDWSSPLAAFARKLFVPYYEQLAALKSAPEFQKPKGLLAKKKA
jgi:nicotinamidase-related amidase